MFYRYIGKNTIETVSRAEALQRTKNVVKDIADVMIDNYDDCDEHCTNSLAGETFPGMVISPDEGGILLRRSVWKKSPVWQFCTTNLNYNVLSWRLFTDDELKTEAHLELGASLGQAVPKSTEKSNAKSKLCTTACITFGVPSAHALGFHDGGLRRLMAGLGTNEQSRMKWMCLLQATGGVSMSLLKKSSGDNAKEFRKLFDVYVDMVTGDGWTTVFQKASKLAMRIDACASQALGFAVTAIKAVLTLATYGEQHQLECLTNAFTLGNFLLPIESFLSTQGHEMGMIEDLEASVLWLCSVRIRLVTTLNQPSSNDGGFIGLCDDLCIRRDPISGSLVVDLEMNRDESAMINEILESIRSSGNAVSTDDIALTVGKSDGVDSKKSLNNESCNILTEFGLTGVVFTCGVNEMQSLVNLSGGKEVHKQYEINAESFARLNRYLDLMKVEKLPKYVPEQDNHLIGKLPLRERLRYYRAELKHSLDIASASPHVKTPGVLIRSAKICRDISGTVGILCKSGKDRTSMGVTLEQSCILSEKEESIVEGQESTRVMRKYGVRRMNVYANTGQGYYAFNGFQQNMLPKCYRPPGGTYGGNVAS